MRAPLHKTKPTPRAFTLIEALLAIALSALVGTAAVLLFGAMGTAAQERFSNRETVVRRQTLSVRLGSLVRAASQALAVSDTALLLWDGDADADGAPNLSELTLVEHDAASRELRSYRAASTLSGGADVHFSADDDLLAAVAGLKGSSLFPAEVVAHQVSKWEVSHNGAIQDAGLLRLRVTSELSSGPDPITIVASLRAR